MTVKSQQSRETAKLLNTLATLKQKMFNQSQCLVFALWDWWSFFSTTATNLNIIQILTSP